MLKYVKPPAHDNLNPAHPGPAEIRVDDSDCTCHGIGQTRYSNYDPLTGFADEYIPEDVEAHENTQHVKDFARNHIKNELYPYTAPGSAMSIGEMVRYEGILKSATLCSH
jgi:hypothetical protein